MRGALVIAQRTPEDVASAARCDVAATHYAVVATHVNNQTIRLALHKNDFMSYKLKTAGWWEVKHPRELAALAGQALPDPPATFIDIGGHIGYYSILFALYGYSVVTIEALSKNRDVLSKTICMNPHLLGGGRIRVVPTALGARPQQGCKVGSYFANVGNAEILCPGSGKLCCPERCNGCGLIDGSPYKSEKAAYASYLAGNWSFSVNRASNKAHDKCRRDWDCCWVHCEPLTLRTLDEVLESEVPHLLDSQTPVIAKIDIEGFECAAFAGGQSLFTRVRPFLVQVEALRVQTQECLHAEAKRHGYGVGERRGHDNNTVLYDRVRHPARVRHQSHARRPASSGADLRSAYR